MIRLVFEAGKGFVWSDWIPKIVEDYGISTTQKKKYVKDKVRINNKEVETGKNRTALYTMPGGEDNGVRYSALYEHSGLDITEINANKQLLAEAKAHVEDKVREEFDKISSETADKISMAKSKSNSSGSSDSSSE